MSNHDAAQVGASPLEKLMQSLQEETTGRQQRRNDFEEAYPTLVQHLARKVPLKVVLATFNAAYGHSLHPPAFRKLLEAERKRRSEAGLHVVCTTCGQARGPSGDFAPRDDMDHEEGGV